MVDSGSRKLIEQAKAARRQKKKKMKTLDDASEQGSQQFLRASEKGLRSILSAMDDLVFVLDKDGVFVEYFQPPSAPELYAQPEEFMGKSSKDVMPPDVIESMDRAVKALAATGQAQQFEYFLPLTDRDSWFSAKVSMRRGPNGENAGYVVVARDITERVEAENALRRSEERYKRLVEGSPDIAYIYSRKNGALFWSSRVEDILGFSPSTLTEKPFLWRDAIHEDDLALVDNVITDGMDGTGFDVEYRIRDTEGKWHWFRDRSIGCYQEGEDVIIEGLATDITEHKRAEEALKESERITRAIFDHTFEFIGLMKTDGTLIEANRTALDFAGVDASDVLGRLFWETVWWTHSPELQQRLRDAVSQTEMG